MSLRDLKVGDTVIMVDANDRSYVNGVRVPSRPIYREVVKVGRKLLHVANGSWKPRTFDLDVGAEQGPGVNSAKIFTVEEWEDRAAIETATSELRQLGVELYLRGGRRLSSDQLGRILAIVEEPS